MLSKIKDYLMNDVLLSIAPKLAAVLIGMLAAHQTTLASWGFHPDWNILTSKTAWAIGAGLAVITHHGEQQIQGGK